MCMYVYNLIFTGTLSCEKEEKPAGIQWPLSLPTGKLACLKTSVVDCNVYHFHRRSVPPGSTAGLQTCIISLVFSHPHWDILGNLIGVRGRGFLFLSLQHGKKYRASWPSRCTDDPCAAAPLAAFPERSDDVSWCQRMLRQPESTISFISASGRTRTKLLGDFF